MCQNAPLISELQLEALFKSWCCYYGAGRHVAYTCICGSGANGSILHYGHAGRPNDRVLMDGDIVQTWTTPTVPLDFIHTATDFWKGYVFFVSPTSYLVIIVISSLCTNAVRVQPYGLPNFKGVVRHGRRVPWICYRPDPLLSRQRQIYPGFRPFTPCLATACHWWYEIKALLECIGPEVDLSSGL